jgi:hypothetical protein
MKFKAVKFKIEGTSPLVQRPLVVRRKRKGDACDFYVAREGWRGIPVYGFRQALLGACKLEGFHLRNGAGLPTVRADGFDMIEGTPLVKITKGKPRDASEVDDKLAGGLVYSKGWKARIVIEFDADIFKVEEIVKIATTAGAEVGLGCKRPTMSRAKRKKGDVDYSYGTFDVAVG